MSDSPGFDKLTDLFRGRPGAGDLGSGQATAEAAQSDGEQAAIIHGAGEQGGMVTSAAGFVSVALPPGMPYAPELTTAPMIPKGDRFPDVPKLWDMKRLTVTASGIVGVMDQIGFPVVTLRVDNWTALYLLVRGPNIYIPPFTVGAIVKTFNNPQSVEIMSEAPPGIVQGAVVVGQVCDVWCFEDDLTPSPGQTITSASGGTVTTTSPVRSTALNTGQATIGAAAGLVIAANVNRRSVVITNVGPAAVYVGNSNAVTTASGEYVGVGQSISFDSYTGTVYVVSGSAGNTVTYAEESA